MNSALVPHAGRGHAAWRGTTSLALSNYVCDSATVKYGKKFDNAVALKELKGKDSAARFGYARSNGMCCGFVCEIKLLDNVYQAYTDKHRKTRLWEECEDARVTKEDRDCMILSKHEKIFLVSLFSKHSPSCAASRTPGSTSPNAKSGAYGDVHVFPQPLSQHPLFSVSVVSLRGLTSRIVLHLASRVQRACSKAPGCL